MARGINKVFLLGNLGADPEIRYTASGAAVGNLRIATSREWFDKAANEKRKETEWHRIVAFGKTAENVEKWLKKGSSVHIEGRIQTRKWQDQAGTDRWTTEIVADEIQFLSGTREAAASSGPPQQRAAPGAPAPAPQDDYDDDIPF